MQTMIEIDGKIVATDILTECFSCDLGMCKGICCVEGNAGAPLDEKEIDILEEEYESYKDYLTTEGVEAIRRYGFVVVDPDGDYTTPLVKDEQCAFSFNENGITKCAIEKAFKEGKTDFQKPISCHLYPIRVAKFGDGTVGLNYHRWNVCSPARNCGKKENMPLYKSLNEPIARAFGEDFFEALEAAAEYLNKMSDSAVEK